jgi:acetyltransferase-like isoleucine patch superfamily enzyme
MMRRFPDSHNALAADPVPWALWLAASRLVHKIKSFLLGILFRAPRLYLGPRCLVRGSRFIKFGTGVCATSNLWIEAVSCYRGERFQPMLEIGDGVSFSHGVRIFCVERVVIQRNVLMGSNIYISDGSHGSYRGADQSEPAEAPAHRCLTATGPVLIAENVWIGDNAVVLGPVNIGQGTVIGANSVVRGDVPPNCIMAGSPAKLVKQFDATSRQWVRV